MINGLEKIELANGINFGSSAYSLRGHNLKLRRELVKKNCSPRYNFLTNRVVNDCNDLPVVVKAKNLNIFKRDWMIE